MLDHVLLDLIAAFSDAMDRALLERQGVEDRFSVDVFAGDVSWETSYSLPGEGHPPRVRVDLALDWPTWSQAAYRSWRAGEEFDEPPEAALEVAVRVQRLAEPPATGVVLAVLVPDGPELGAARLRRVATTVEEVREDPEAPGDEPGGRRPGDGPSAAGPSGPRFAVEARYAATVRLEERQLEDPGALAPLGAALTAWVSSVLVRLADLPLAFAPPDPDGEG